MFNTGKTLQTITMLAWLRENRGMLGPHLIVVPLNVLETWVDEVKRWCPYMKCVRFHGSDKERQRICDEILDIEHYDILVTTFETLVSAEGWFTHRMFAYVVVDEAHRIKNDQSLASQALRRIPCFNKLLLTGTPIQNNLIELWALLNYLYPTIFNNSMIFKHGFNVVTGHTDPQLLLYAQSLLSIVMLRRLKKNVAPNLPHKTEYLISCPLSDTQTYWYKQFLSQQCDMLDQVNNDIQQNGDVVVMTEKQDESNESNVEDMVDINDTTANKKYKKDPRSSPTLDEDQQHLMSHMNTSNTTDDSWRKLMNLMCRLRQISNHPYLIRGVRPDEYDDTVNVNNDELRDTSGKMQLLHELLHKLHSESHRVLIFSSFTMMLDLLEEYMQQYGYKYMRLDGSTTRVQRKFEVNRFNKDHTFFVYLISTRAGGLGVNLPTADTVIHYDSDWNPQADLQAQDRAHRIGQTRPVTVYRLVTSGTVEERMVARAQKKLYLDSRVMGSSSSGDIQQQQQALDKWTKKDLLSMIKYGADNVLMNNHTHTKIDINHILQNAIMLRHSHNQANININDEHTNNNNNTESAESVFDNALSASVDNINIKELSITAFNGKELSKKGFRDQADIWVDTINARSAAGESITRDRAQTTVLHGRDAVLKENRYDGFTSDLGRAVIHDSKVIDILYRNFVRHEQICHQCKDGGMLVLCNVCPRSYHLTCLGLTESDIQSGTYRCPQHECSECERRASDAGGLLFRCVNCANAYCEDHCMNDIEPIYDVPELDVVGYRKPTNAYYILCSQDCITDYKHNQHVIQHEINDILFKQTPAGLTNEIHARIRLLLAGNFKPDHPTTNTVIPIKTESSHETSTISHNITHEQLVALIAEYMLTLDMSVENNTTIRTKIELHYKLPLNSLKSKKSEIAQISKELMYIYYSRMNKTNNNNNKRVSIKSERQMKIDDSKKTNYMDLKPKLVKNLYHCPFTDELCSDTGKPCVQTWSRDDQSLDTQFIQHRSISHPEMNVLQPESYLIKPKLINDKWQCAFYGDIRDDTTNKPCTQQWDHNNKLNIMELYNQHKDTAHTHAIDPAYKQQQQNKLQQQQAHSEKLALKKVIDTIIGKEKNNVGEMTLDDIQKLVKTSSTPCTLSQLSGVAEQFLVVSPRSNLLIELHRLLYNESPHPKSAVKQHLLQWSGLPHSATYKQASELFSRIWNEIIRWKLDTILDLGKLLNIQTRTEPKKLANGRITHTDDRLVSKIDPADGLYQHIALLLLLPRQSRQFIDRRVLQIYADEKYNTT